MPTNAINDTGVKYLYDKLHDEIEGCINDDVETVIGNPLNFSTKFAQHAKSTKLTLEPIQDLHGFTKPWVGGAGKNKLPLTLDKFMTDNTGGIWSGNTYVLNGITYTVNTDSDGNVIGIKTNGTASSTSSFIFLVQMPAGSYAFNGCPTGGNTSKHDIEIKKNSPSGDFIARDEGNGTSFTISETTIICAYIRIASGYTIPTGEFVFYPMLRLATVSDSTFEPYENICPISGYDEIDLNGCGKNLIDIPSKTLAGEDYIVQNLAWLIHAGTYTFSFNSSVQSGNWLIVGKNSSNVEVLRGGNIVGQPFTFTLSDSIATINIYVNVGGTFSEFQLEEGSTATEYEPYQSSNNLSIDLPSTVYGGVLDLESGELVVDKVFEQKNGGITAKDSQNKLFLIPLAQNIKPWAGDAPTPYVITNYLDRYTLSDLRLQEVFGVCQYAGNIYIRLGSSITDIADANSYLSSNPLQVCYTLATPQTIQLTPHQLNLFKEQNNISSNVTSISVTYKKGILTVIEPATESSDGIMSVADKQKLDSIADDATKTESSTTNGNIKINGTETQVYDDSEINGELTTDTTTVDGNPLNFNTISAQHAESTIIDIDPIQDLHGFDKPWVGGAGKNLCKLTVDNLKAFNTSGSWSGNTYTKYNVNFTILTDTDNNVIGINVNGTNNESSVANFDLAVVSSTLPVILTGDYIINGCPANGSASSYNIRVGKGSSSSYVGNDFGNGLSATFNNEIITMQIHIASGATVSNKVFQPMIRLSTETDATFAPYTNICPISGRTEVGILGCAYNLMPNVTEQGSINAEGGYELVSDSRIRTPYIYLPAGTYTLSNGESLQEVIDTYDKYKNYIHIPTLTSWADSPRTFTCQEGYYRFLFRKSNNATLTPSELLTPQLEKNNQATQYTAYQSSNDLTISLGQTVYGGTIDVEKGKLVVDRRYDDLGDFTWEYNSQYSVFISQSLVNHKVGESNLISSNYETSEPVSVANIRNYTIKGNPRYPTTFYTKDPRYNDAATFKTAVSGVQLVYELASPITIQLTPNTINLLKGVNNISTDGDKITLTYRDGKVATLGDLTSAVDNLDSKIDESKILTDTATGDKYILVVTNGVLSVEQISN